MAYAPNRAKRTPYSSLADQLYPEDDRQDDVAEDEDEDDAPEEASDNRTPMQKAADELYSSGKDVAGEEEQGADDEEEEASEGDEQPAQKNNDKDNAPAKVINGSKSESYDTYVKTGGSRSWRNNNPGNIEYKGQEDAVGVEKGGRFAKYPTPEAGMSALKNLLNTVYKNMSVTAALRKYAPMGKDNNNPEAYAKFLEKNGVDLKKPVGQQVDAMAEAIKKQEGWIEGRVTAKK